MSNIAICTVTHNSAEHLKGWWTSICESHAKENDSESRYPGRADLAVRVIVVDCASTDGSLQALDEFAKSAESSSANSAPPLKVIASTENLGFAGGMNRCLQELTPDDEWVCALNPDARLMPGALTALTRAFTSYEPVPEEQPASAAGGSAPPFKVGAVTARLIRLASGQEQELDACGMYWTKSWRHLDRGSGKAAVSPDGKSRYGAAEEVVAGTGAGTAYLVEALRDVALPDSLTSSEQTEPSGRPQIFNEDFHSFREDAELGLRLQRRGWHCVYEPAATIEHRRHNLPERRSTMSESVNRHSLKNRYLLRLLHQSPGNAARTLPAVVRDLGILFYVLLRERSSLPAYSWLWRNRTRIKKQRKWLNETQTIRSPHLDRWFANRSFPLRTLNQDPDNRSPNPDD